MDGKNWSEFEEYECKLENRRNTFFVRWRKTIAEKKAKNEQKS